MTLQIPTMTEEVESPSNERARVLELARQLNRIGRSTERFLSMQLQQLELAIADFEHERAAWRRQQQRESAQLEELRNQLLQQQQDSVSRSNEQSPVTTDRPASEKRLSSRVRQEVAATGGGPLRVLLQPGSASRMQIGLVMFEASKLNREIGGEGVRFEVKDCRTYSGSGETSTILEFEVFSHARLIGSPRELQIWETYKSGLVMSSLLHPALESDFKKGTAAPRDSSVRSLGTDAASRAFEANARSFAEDRVHGPAFQATGGMDAVRQQLGRLESLVDLLKRDHGLLVNVSLL